EDRRILQVAGRAGEDRPVHQRLDVLRRDVAIGKDLLGPAIDRDDAIETAGKRVGVELKENGLHGGVKKEERRGKKEDGRRAAAFHPLSSFFLLPSSFFVIPSPVIERVLGVLLLREDFAARRLVLHRPLDRELGRLVVVLVDLLVVGGLPVDEYA